jgi:A/G-specific adenine glycosylase
MEYPPHNGEIEEVRRTIMNWGGENLKSFPWREPERAWQGLIAEVLLQRTRAESVVPVFEKFCERYPTIQDFASASEDEIEELIEPLGLRKRAPLLNELGNELSTLGEIPKDRETLEDLPGIGPYTAGAWLSFHCGRSSSIVDANVVRWVCRMIGHDYDRSTRRKEWFRELVGEITPDNETATFNYSVLDFAREICRPKSPRCEQCPLGPSICSYGKRKMRTD